MSIELIVWASRQKTGSPTRKFVLLTLANITNHKTGRCDPGIDYICEQTELSNTAVRTALAKLVEVGLLKRERKRRSDGSLGTYTYSFPPGAGDEVPPTGDDAGLATGDDARPPTGDDALNQEELNQEGLNRSTDIARTREASMPNVVDRKTVTDYEATKAIDILAVWNELAGQDLRSKDWLSKIIMRVREYPEATILDHRLIIETALKDPWWKGPPSPSVVYGNGAQFERAIQQVRTKRRDDTRIERIVNRITEGRAA